MISSWELAMIYAHSRFLQLGVKHKVRGYYSCIRESWMYRVEKVEA